MKKRFSIIMMTTVIGFILPTLAIGNDKLGHRIYKKKLQKKCGFYGSVFSRKHTQDEWEKIKEQGKFKEETIKICPKFDKTKLSEKQWNDLYDFTYRYGKGGEIPGGCNDK